MPPSPGDAAAGRSLDTPAFLRLFQLRSSQIMWFLGAGSSRSAGIKTAGDMIWDFKQRLYRSQRKLPPSAITDIGEAVVHSEAMVPVLSGIGEDVLPPSPPDPAHVRATREGRAHDGTPGVPRDPIVRRGEAPHMGL